MTFQVSCEFLSKLKYVYFELKFSALFDWSFWLKIKMGVVHKGHSRKIGIFNGYRDGFELFK